MAKSGCAASGREAVSCPRSGARGSKAAADAAMGRASTEGDGKEVRCGADLVVGLADGLNPSETLS